MTEFTTWRSLVDGEEISAIPDELVSQFKIDEGDGTTLNNEFESQPNATISGADFESDNDLVGGFGLRFDGDQVDIDDLFDFVGPNDQFAFAITVDLDNLNINQVFWFISDFDGSNNIGGISVGTGRDTSGKFAVDWRDQDFNAISQRSIDSAATTDRVRLGVDFDGETDTIDMFINGTQSDDGEEAADSTGDDSNTIGYRPGRTETNGVLDNPNWYDGLLGESGHTEDFDRQPWS